MNKIETIRKKMRELSLDALIVFDELNQRYVSNFAFTDGLLFITLNSAYLITDFRYFEMAEKSADKCFKVVIPEERFSFVKTVISNENCRQIGFEGGSVSYDTYKRYSDALGAQLVSIGRFFEEIREVKTEYELALISRAQNITDAAFTHVLKMLTPNMTEIDVALELEYAMRKNGADGFAFDTIAVSGDASALPHGTPRNVKLKKGFLTMDFGAKFDGYCSDMTRTVVIGRADSDMKKLYNTVLDAQNAAIRYLKEGIDCADADKVARDIIDTEYSGCFGHSLGHSVGLFIHETPTLSKRMAGRKLRIGEVLTVEPGIYLYGKYGCRIEDMVAIEEFGVNNFTKSGKDLIEIT